MRSLTIVRRVHRHPALPRDYVRTDNCTRTTTAASPLPGWYPGGEQNRRRQPPRNMPCPRRTPMTIPAHAGTASVRHEASMLPIPSPAAPDVDTTAAVRAALSVPLSASAFRVYLAAVVTLPHDQLVASEHIGAAAGISDHQARPLVGELVKAGLLRKRQVLVAGRGRDSRVARNRYLIVVPAATS